MLKTLRDRVGRAGDRMLARVAPRAAADAACGNWVYCCGINEFGQYELGQWRRDVEHNGICTPCYALNQPC